MIPQKKDESHTESGQSNADLSSEDSVDPKDTQTHPSKKEGIILSKELPGLERMRW
ncbi:MAG: hypothetical protein HQL32_01015 [Planctomycetes bacterium]|nr:hypothetical protein [Planctomycetota bacterium]